MSGYIDRSDPDIPLMTRERWIGFGIALLGAGAMLFLSLVAGKAATGLLASIGKIPATAPLMFILGSSFLLQRKPEPGAPSPFFQPARRPRLIAYFFFALGIVMIAASLILK